MKIRELLPALLISPWAVVPVVVVSGLGTSDAGISSDFGWGLFFSVIFAVPAAYLGVFLFGLPVFLILRKFNVASPLLLCIVGGATPLLALLDAGRSREVIVASVCGLAVAVGATQLLPKVGRNAP